MTIAAQDAETLLERRGGAGFIVLNRPEALNALTLTMVRTIAGALEAWENDEDVDRVVIRGAGERAFCSGGDIRHLYELGMAGDHASQLRFWREEYLLDRRIKTYSKPIVALVDGIVMGGGVGLSINASHTIAGDRFVFAMPEVGIGFFPDTGASWFLPRLPRRAGLYLALTGLRADAGDAMALGLADTFAPSAVFGDLAEALAGRQPVEATLASFAAPAPQSALMRDAAQVETCFSFAGREAILAALLEAAARGHDFAGLARAAMLKKSPTSQAIALMQMARGQTIDFDEALRMEFRIVSRICKGRDFYEGVRAVIVDKDNRPHWSELPTQTEVEAYFATLGDAELTFPVRGR